MGSKVSIADWDNNNKSLEFLQVRYTDVLGRFLARYLSMPADIEGFFYKLSESRKRVFGIRPLPSSLQEALAALKNDHMYLQSCFATELLQSYLALKGHEIKKRR